jgi:RNA polymerase sigma-70 factor (ECF subfamily)
LSDQQRKVLDFLETSGVRLHALLVRLTLRAEVAEDLMQELFIKLSQSKGFERAEVPEAYASRAAIHLAFDWRRRQKKAPLDGALTVEPATSLPSPLATLIRREEVEEVLAALESLPEPGRDCLVLRYLQQESYETIAEQLGRTPHQVRALCHKAMVKLRSLVRLGPPLGTAKEYSRDDT